jgi:hypothetical protein
MEKPPTHNFSSYTLVIFPNTHLLLLHISHLAPHRNFEHCMLHTQVHRWFDGLYPSLSNSTVNLGNTTQNYVKLLTL